MRQSIDPKSLYDHFISFFKYHHIICFLSKGTSGLQPLALKKPRSDDEESQVRENEKRERER